MGGHGSGQRSGSRDTTTNYRALDVRWLHRKNSLALGRSSTVTWSRNGEPIGSIGLRMESSRMVFNYRHSSYGGEWQSLEYSVGIEFTSPNYGGERPWFLCPAQGCGRRVAILYSGRIFACRRCYGLAYESQTESPAYRALSRTQNIRMKLGGSGSMAEDFPDKPKGMHWKTYLRFVSLGNEYERISNEKWMGWLETQRARLN